jgi:hypothetical protein
MILWHAVHLRLLIQMSLESVELTGLCSGGIWTVVLLLYVIKTVCEALKLVTLDAFTSHEGSGS